jgi:hypothetical protein
MAGKRNRLKRTKSTKIRSVVNKIIRMKRTLGLSRHSSDPRLRKLADELHELEFGHLRK